MTVPLYISCSTCSNGATICRNTLSSDEENFTTDGLHLLKVQLLKRLYAQMYLLQDPDADVSSEMMAEITDQRAIEATAYTVPWKYGNMKKNWFGQLYSRTIRNYAHDDVSLFTCSYSLVSNFEAILNVNADGGVGQAEFTDFFNLTESKSKLEL